MKFINIKSILSDIIYYIPLFFRSRKCKTKKTECQQRQVHTILLNENIIPKSEKRH